MVEHVQVCYFALVWSSSTSFCMYRCFGTFANYLGYLRAACHAMGFDAPPVGHPAIKRAMCAIVKRELFVPRTRMFIPRCASAPAWVFAVSVLVAGNLSATWSRQCNRIRRSAVTVCCGYLRIHTFCGCLLRYTSPCICKGLVHCPILAGLANVRMRT